MTRSTRRRLILCAEDDPDDRLLIAEAFQESGLDHTLHFVVDGEELMAYVCEKSAESGSPTRPRPDLILLDLNMPRKDGREVLQELKADPKLRSLPVVVFTTSTAEEDIRLSYEMSANSFVVKPGRFQSLVETIQSIGQYWFDTVQLPSSPVGCGHARGHD